VGQVKGDMGGKEKRQTARREKRNEKSADEKEGGGKGVPYGNWSSKADKRGLGKLESE